MRDVSSYIDPIYQGNDLNEFSRIKFEEQNRTEQKELKLRYCLF